MLGDDLLPRTSGVESSRQWDGEMLAVRTRDVFSGPSLYARCPVVRLVLGLEPGDLNPVQPVSDSLRQGCELLFPDQSIRPALRELLQEPKVHTGELLAAFIVQIQQLMRSSVDFAMMLELPNCNFAVVYEFETLDMATIAEGSAAGLINDIVLGSAGHNPRFSDNISAGRQKILQAADAKSPSIDTRYLLAAARSRDVPVQLLDADIMRFGLGARCRRVNHKLDDRITCAAVEMARDKHLTNVILAENWLPVPAQRLTSTAEQALSAARAIGFPVVVKPRSRDNGVGVTAGVAMAADVGPAFAIAAEGGCDVIVEAMLPGSDHRLLIIDGKLVAATRRVPGHVIGDGRLSVCELVDTVNLDPQRGNSNETPLAALKIDDEALRLLAASGLTLASVPLRGQHVPLRRAANLSRGSTAVDATDIVHPDNCRAAVQAAKVLNLGVAGVDLICPDITRSYKETGGGICEVNFSPGLRTHMAPSEGRIRDVAGAMIDHLFATPAASRIPVAAVTGTNGRTTTCRMLAAILARQGLCVGLTCTEGAFIGGVEFQRGDMANPGPARNILQHKQVEAAVLECGHSGIIKWGVGFNDCNVAAVTNVQDDHIGEPGVSSIEEMAQVKQLIVELARDMAVLNADDSHCRAMAEHLSAKRLCWVTMAADNPLVDTHIANGGTAVRLTNNGSTISLHAGGEAIDLMPVADIPATLNGTARHNTANALVAVALAHGLGISAATICDALRAFDIS